MRKIVIFGGNGFIGQHLARRLAADRSNKITVFDRFSSYQVGDTKKPFAEFPNIELIPGNFENRANLNQALKGAEYVFHLISTTNPALSNNDPFIDIDTNIRPSVELFELCVENKVKKVIYLSSGGAIYGETDSKKINEYTLPKPVSPYAIGKLTIESYLSYFKRTHNLNYVVYRVANPFGPGQNIHGKQGVIPIFMYKYFTKEALTVYGDGSMTRDYLYIDDLVEMIVGSYLKKNTHDIYNLGSGVGRNINEIISAIEKNTGYKVKKEKIEVPLTFTKSSVLDVSRFNDEFNIEAAVGFEEGIKRTWDYVKELK